MPASQHHALAITAAGKLAERVPGLRALPVVRLVMAAEVLMLTKAHLDRLTPAERGRMIRLVTQARGRPRNLSVTEQRELETIVNKLDPRMLLAEAGDRISPIGVPAPLLRKLSGGRPVR